MAMRQDEGTLTKKEIAKAEGISADYVGQLLMKLATAGLVTSYRGKKGGFALGRAATQITMDEVLAATEGSLAVVPCTEGDCSRVTECSTRQLWGKLNRSILDILKKTTVKQLADEATRLRRSGLSSYDI
jgi:Rrf2 family iron-sulfur cluster assembly transcriptional regulator